MFVERVHFNQRKSSLSFFSEKKQDYLLEKHRFDHTLKCAFVFLLCYRLFRIKLTCIYPSKDNL